MAKLNATARKRLPIADFAVKSKAVTPQGKARSGSYPINDVSHARNALARSAGKPVAGAVRAAVARKFPGIGDNPKDSPAKERAERKAGKKT